MLLVQHKVIVRRFGLQTGTKNQFVVIFIIHPYAADTSCLKEHMEGVKETWGKLLEETKKEPV